MTRAYQRPAGSGGLRLHLNENTAGCSPKVLQALQRVTREEAALYPDYDEALAATAARLGVGTGHVLLTNGLDEGILLTALVALRGAPAASPFEALVVQPAFDMYAACAEAVGGRVIDVAPRPDFRFPLDELLRAATARTRVIFLTSPNNPTGISIAPADVRAVAAAVPQALVLLDEAYVDFGGETMIHEAVSGAVSNLIVGRTFAKAYGLAGVRAGALVASGAPLEPLKRAVLPYPLNVFAAAALPAALDDAAYYEWYLAQVRESKALLYATLDRLGVEYWPSDGNFLLARFGAQLARVVSGLAERGVIIRDRSKDPGCAGCARMTAGVLAHTRQLAVALEEVLCAAR